MFENAERTDLKELGEFGLIEHITQSIELKNDSTILGVGDDAAVVDYGEKKETVVSTDMLVEGVHFDLMYTPLKHLGYKAVTVNLSDLAAMNARPAQITVSLALSSRFPVEAVEELYKGIYLACERYNVDLIGGDTTSSRSGLIISVTAIGEVEKGKSITRKGAQENDLICVTGDLGAAYMGLQILEREKAVFKENSKVQPDLSGHDYIIERQLKPEARTFLKAALKKNQTVPTAMIDVSDGLASELIHLTKASNCGVQIYEEKLPIDFTTSSTAEEFKIAPVVCALNGGEDYELLFTVPASDYEKVELIEEVSVIGHVTEAGFGAKLVGRGGDQVDITAQGWNSFSKEE